MLLFGLLCFFNLRDVLVVYSEPWSIWGLVLKVVLSSVKNDYMNDVTGPAIETKRNKIENNAVNADTKYHLSFPSPSKWGASWTAVDQGFY